MRRALLPMAAALALPLGCPEPIVVAGEEVPLTLRVKIADIPQPELADVGSFALELRRDGERVLEAALDFNTTTRALTFNGEPLEFLPGRYDARLRARDRTNAPLAIGGQSTALVVDAAGGGELQILIGALEKFTPLDGGLETARFGHGAAALPGGAVLVVGGHRSGDADAPGALAPSVELVDPFGTTCSSDAGLDGCGVGEVPARRSRHAMVSLAPAGDACPAAGGALIFGGEDDAGDALGDTWLFDPATRLFRRLDDLQARADARAIALSDCRVLVVGGLSSPSDPTSATTRVDILNLVTESASTFELPSPVAKAALVGARNAIDDVLVLGGTDALGQASAVAMLISTQQESACDLSAPLCNGSDAPVSLACARANPIGAEVLVDGELARLVVAGDDDAGTCAAAGAPAELLTEDVDPFYRLSTITIIGAGATGQTLSPLPASALLAGGRAADGTILDTVERFSVAGTFNTASPLGAARMAHAATSFGGNVFVVGGHDDDGPRSDLELYVVDMP